MTRGTYSAEDIIKALSNWNFYPVDREGSHVKLRYIDPNTGEKRNVTIPKHDELAPGTLKSIAEQAGANDPQKFLDEMDKMI